MTVTDTMSAAATLTLTVAALAAASLLAAPDARGAFAGADGAIAYVVSNGVTPYRLGSSYITGAPNGAPLAESEADRGGDSFSPAWAPDGRDLAFASTRSGSTAASSARSAKGRQWRSRIRQGYGVTKPLGYAEFVTRRAQPDFNRWFEKLEGDCCDLPSGPASTRLVRWDSTMR